MRYPALDPLSFIGPFLGGQLASGGVDTWHITSLVSPIPGEGPALRNLQGASNALHFLCPPLYSSSSSFPHTQGLLLCNYTLLLLPSTPRMPQQDPLATGHLASGVSPTLHPPVLVAMGEHQLQHWLK